MTTKDDLGKSHGDGSRQFEPEKAAAPLTAVVAGQVEFDRTGVSEVRPRGVSNDYFAATGEVRTFRIDLGGKLAVTLEGPQGDDFDLYVKHGSPPTIEDYDLVGYSMSANEKVVIDSPESGDCYLMVRSYRGAGDFSLRVDLD